MTEPSTPAQELRTERGRFVISLDFELHWGVRDQKPISAYRQNLLGVREVVPRTLELFDRHAIRATWATVGFLMADDRDELLAYLPRVRPDYRDPRLDPYRDLSELGENERDDPFHFAPSLVRMIQTAPGQEIGTHTMSHLYALEPDVSDAAFRADLEAALKLAARHEISPTSIVFPRNQVRLSALRVCAECGLTAFRGTERAWHQSPRAGAVPPAARALRLLDAYAALGSDHVQAPHLVEGLVNVPQSRFLRSCRGRLGRLDDLRLRRIERAMSSAAQTGTVFHLWWHPHGFGAEPATNLEFLERILVRYRALHDSLGMESMTMRDVAEARMVIPR